MWQLVRGDELLAGLVVTGGNFPWLSARVRPAAGFADVRPLFYEELRRLEFIDAELEQREAADRRLREVVCLVAPDWRAVPEFLLHIDGEKPGDDGTTSPSRSRKTNYDDPRIAARRTPHVVSGLRKWRFCPRLTVPSGGSSVATEAAIGAGRSVGC